MANTKAALQIGDISISNGRVWISGLVLSGAVADGDRLEAVGLTTTLCIVDEVLVAGVRRRAIEGEECQIFLLNPDESFIKDGTKIYMGLVEPDTITNATQLRVALIWASLRDKPGGYAPAAQPISEDTKVEFRFVDINISGTVKKPAKVLPASGKQEFYVVLDKPLPIIPNFGFSMNINGDFAAMGKVIGLF
jgi:translation elongation factor EF-Tu-like GTPase